MSTRNTPQVVVAGHICFDVIPSFRHTEPAAIDSLFVPCKQTHSTPAGVAECHGG